MIDSDAFRCVVFVVAMFALGGAVAAFIARTVARADERMLQAARRRKISEK